MKDIKVLTMEERLAHTIIICGDLDGFLTSLRSSLLYSLSSAHSWLHALVLRRPSLVW